MANVLEVMGVDVSDRVQSWGVLEEVMEVLLAEATLFTSEMRFGLASADVTFAPAGAGSLVAGLSFYDQPAELTIDGALAFRGYVRDVEWDSGRRVATLIVENALKRPAETAYSGTGDEVNPGAAILGILRSALAEDQIDAAAILAAGGPAAAAGATVSWDFSSSSSTSVMEAVQEVASLASIVVFERGGRITARAFHAYQGDGSGLKYAIEDAVVREWGPVHRDTSSFFNRIVVGYPTDLTVELQDEASVRASRGVIRTRTYSSSAAVFAPDRPSALHFCATGLARSALRRIIVPATLAKASAPGAGLADDFPVTQEAAGFSGLACRAFQVRRRLDTDEIELTLAQLPSEG